MPVYNKLMLNYDCEKLKEICRRYKVRELSLFGSTARGDARPDSDIDLLVDFEPGASIGLFEMVEMRDELRHLFGGREVDLVSKEAVLEHKNPIRKKSILENTEMLYAA